MQSAHVCYGHLRRATKMLQLPREPPHHRQKLPSHWQPGCAERNVDRYKQEQDGRILDGGLVGEEAARAVRFCAGSKSSITSEHTLEPYIRYSPLP